MSRNVAQASVTVIVAIAFSAATYLSGQASGQWSQSVKENVKWSAGLIEDARYLFVDEGPLAYEYAVAQARADALVEAASGLPPREAGAALIEADLIRTSAEVMREAFTASRDSLMDEKYWNSDHFDLGERLHDLRAQGTVQVDLEAYESSGNRYAQGAMAVALLPLPITVAYLLFVWRAHRSNVRAQTESAADPGVELIPDPTRGSHPRGVAYVAFGAWVLLVLIPPLQVHQSLRSADTGAGSTNGAVEVMRNVIVGNLVASFKVQVQNQVVALQGLAERRAINYENLPPTATQGQGAIVQAEEAMRMRHQQLADHTITSSTEVPDLDLATVAALTADPEDWEADLQEQQALADEAERAGLRDDAMTLALVLASIATTLAALAIAERRFLSVPIMAVVAVVSSATTAAVGSLL